MDGKIRGCLKLRGTNEDLSRFFSQGIRGGNCQYGEIAEKGDVFPIHGVPGAFIRGPFVLYWDIPYDRTEATAASVPFEQTGSLAAAEWIHLSNRYRLDIRIHGFDAQRSVSQDVEVIDGRVTRSRETEYPDWNWDYPFTFLAGDDWPLRELRGVAGSVRLHGKSDDLKHFFSTCFVSADGTISYDYTDTQCAVHSTGPTQMRLYEGAGLHQATSIPGGITVKWDVPGRSDEPVSVSMPVLSQGDLLWMDWSFLSRKYGLDIRLYGFRCGLRKTQELEFIRGQMTKAVETFYWDWNWDCPIPCFLHYHPADFAPHPYQSWLFP